MHRHPAPPASQLGMGSRALEDHRNDGVRDRVSWGSHVLSCMSWEGSGLLQCLLHRQQNNGSWQAQHSMRHRPSPVSFSRCKWGCSRLRGLSQKQSCIYREAEDSTDAVNPNLPRSVSGEEPRTSLAVPAPLGHAPTSRYHFGSPVPFPVIHRVLLRCCEERIFAIPCQCVLHYSPSLCFSPSTARCS